MKINERILDINKVLHDLSFEYAKQDLQQYLKDNPKNNISDVQLCLDVMFSSYVRAFGYLSQYDDKYIKELLESH